MTTDATQPGHRSGFLLEASLHARSVDPAGDRLHLWAAAAFLLLNPIGSGASTIGFLALFSIVILRLVCALGPVQTISRNVTGGSLEVVGLPPGTYTDAFRHPVIIAILLYLGWLTLGLLWASPSRSLGIEDVVSHRMLLLPLLLLPVLHHARVLVIAFLAGTVAVNLIQLLEWQEWPAWLEWRSFEKTGRAGAFNNEIVTGLFMATAICFWIRWLLVARRWWWLVPFLALCLVGWLLAGSRGPIVGGLIAGVLSLLLPFVLERSLRRRVLAIGLLGCILLLPLAAWKWSYIGGRFQQVIEQWDERDTDPASSVGKRVLMTEYGLACFKARPLLGTGPGNAGRYLPNERTGDTLLINGDSYDWDSRFAILQNPDAFKGEAPDRLNLHSTYIQVLATLGFPGLLLFCCMLACGLRSAWRLVGQHGLLAGTFFGILAWAIVGFTDSLQIGGSKLSMLGVLLAFSMLGAARHAGTGLESSQSG